MPVTTIALLVVAYLVAGLLICKTIITMDDTWEAGKWDDDEAGFAAFITLAWPLVIVISIVVGLVRITKIFLSWDIKAHRAARNTKRIESALSEGDER